MNNEFHFINNNNPLKLSEPFYNIVIKAINDMFPLLTGTDKEYLINATSELVIVIGYKFSFMPPNTTLFYNQLIQNDFQDMKALVLLLLPHIDDDEENTKKKSLVSFNDLYKKKN